MTVKWNGVTSSKRDLNGGGPQGATFGVWEYLAQSNSNANCVDNQYRFKFVDDLTTLEKVNLLVTGLTSFNIKLSVPNDIPTHNQFIPQENLQSSKTIENIKEWTKNQKMMLNQKKTKIMLFNFTNNYQFTTRLSLNNENLEVVKSTKLLGVMISDDLKWDENTHYLVKKAFQRMELLRKVSNYTNSKEDKRQIYISYIRSILEQSCTVWHNSLTQENSNNLERVQKAAVKIILGNGYINNYKDALIKADLETLNDRRETLCKNFAKKCINNEKTENIFKKNKKKHKMKTKNPNKYEIQHAYTSRFKNSAIPYMRRLLNLENKKEKVLFN